MTEVPTSPFLNLEKQQPDEAKVEVGIYSNAAGFTCRVIGTAYYKNQHKRVVVYEDIYGTDVSRLHVEDIADFLDLLKRGEYEYHGVKYKTKARKVKRK